MIIKYFDTDYMTYKEDEILFVGSIDECIEYLLDNWVDADDNNHLYYAFNTQDEFKRLIINQYRR